MPHWITLPPLDGYVAVSSFNNRSLCYHQQMIFLAQPCSLFQLERGKDEFVDGTSGVVDEVHQLAVVRPGLELPRKESERGILGSIL